MLARLFLIFISVPLIELVLLLYIKDQTDWTFTLGLVIVTGFVGAWLARVQGWHTYQKIQQKLSNGRMPKDSLLDAAMIFVAGALLLTPGILTDAFGISLLLPSCRQYYRKRLGVWMKSKVSIQTFTSKTGRSDKSQDRIIDSYVVHNDDDEG